MVAKEEMRRGVSKRREGNNAYSAAGWPSKMRVGNLDLEM
jgi:hypothetical protein